jgi:hypothetical protein
MRNVSTHLTEKGIFLGAARRHSFSKVHFWVLLAVVINEPRRMTAGDQLS